MNCRVPNWRYDASFGSTAQRIAGHRRRARGIGRLRRGRHANLVVTPIVTTGFAQTNLVADISSLGARTIDPNLVNPWGLAFDAAGALWTANNGTGTSTSYTANGAKLLPAVAIPSAVAGEPGAPTGMIYNVSPDFVVPGSGAGPALGAATLIFAGEDGTISAWNSAAGSSAVLVADRSAEGAVYKGIAMAVNGGASSCI